MKNLASVFLALAIAACSSSAKPPIKPNPDPKPPAGALSCEAKLVLPCPDGAADGCLDARTQFHVCVATGETAGPSCEQEIAKVCGEGEIDACLTTPAFAANHVCVFAPAPVAAGPTCAGGQEHFVPGCGSTVPFAEGCYAQCGTAACQAGFECKSVTINPCHGQACAACGAEAKLCMPSA